MEQLYGKQFHGALHEASIIKPGIVDKDFTLYFSILVSVGSLASIMFPRKMYARKLDDANTSNAKCRANIIIYNSILLFILHLIMAIFMTETYAAYFSVLKVLEYVSIMCFQNTKKMNVESKIYHAVSILLGISSSLLLNSEISTFLIRNNLVYATCMYFYILLRYLASEGASGVRLLKRCVVISGIFIKILETLSLTTIMSTEISTLGYWFLQIWAIISALYCFQLTKKYVRFFHKNYRDAMTSFLFYFHVFAIVGAIKMYHHPRGLRIFIEAIIFYILSGFGITIGAHRLWAHRTFSAKLSFRIILMILNSIANQGCIFHWARDHRVHHKYSEKDADPHNASRGFFYSHIGWLLLKKPRAVIEAGNQIDCSDLLADPVVVFQRKYDPYWNQFFCFFLPSLYGYYVYGSFWIGFFALGAFRWIMCLHATWTVNSVAHLWGQRPYDPNINPAESLITSLLAVGEGWHNWHHVYPFDYAASEGGIFSQWNPSKFIIDSAAYLGLVSDRKRATELWSAARRHNTLTRMNSISLYSSANCSADDADQALDEKYWTRLLSCLPPHCMKKSLIRSTLNLVRDLLICSSIAAFAILIKESPIGVFCSETSFVNQTVNLVLWTFYAIAQGTVAFGVWVLGYEASGHRFSDYRIINHIIGMVLHSALLIPYRPRRARKERQRASLMKCLREDAFAILKIASLTTWIIGKLLVAVMLFVCFCLAFQYGWYQLAKWYVGPWIVLNIWMLLYHWLLENGPQDNEHMEISGNTLHYFTYEWLRDMWPRATRGRKYPWTFFVDHLHHHLSFSHFIQAVDFDVPHYHAKEAFRKLGEALEEFGEILDAKSKLRNAGITLLQGSSMRSVARVNVRQ